MSPSSLYEHELAAPLADACPHCDGLDLWCVAPVRERATSGSVVRFLRTEEGSAGDFELYVCFRCGLAQWQLVLSSLSAAQKGQINRRIRPDASCVCGQIERYVAPLLDVSRDDALAAPALPARLAWPPRGAWPPPLCTVAVGELEAEACCQCGLVRWYATELSALDESADPEVTVCPAGCGGGTRFRTRAREQSQQGLVDRPIAIRVTAWGWQPWGTLDLLYCRHCGLCEWEGKNLRQLREDKHAGVRRVLATRPTAQGPYR